MAEYRISIYGRKQSEWDQLASWFVNNELYGENVVWLIQASFGHVFGIFAPYNLLFLVYDHVSLLIMNAYSGK